MYLIAELGHNHNGSLSTALAMIDAAADAGANAVKIQCRTLPDDIPPAKRNTPKVVPWTGETLPYAEYRQLCEHDPEAIMALSDRAYERGLHFGASLWGVGQVERWSTAKPWADFYKLASASLTDYPLINAMSALAVGHGRPFIMSTGGASWREVDRAVDAVHPDAELWIAQCTSTYPCPPEHANVRVIAEMRRRYFGRVERVGFSNHCVSPDPALAAVALGAEFVEAHFTLDRSMPGTDQAASWEPGGFAHVKRHAATMRAALGRAEKAVQPGETAIMAKLRRAS